MVIWGLLASAVGLCVNLVHPHKIEFIRTPPPPTVDDPAIPDPIEIDVLMANNFYAMGEYLFVDSRPRVQYERGHIEGAVNLPWEALEKYYDPLQPVLKSKPALVVYCDGAACDSSHNLAKKLIQKGFPEVYVFFGGWEEWKEMDLPIKEGLS